MHATAAALLDAPGDRTVAEAQINLVADLADVCTPRGRWYGAHDERAPAACAFFLISAPSVAWVDAAAAHPRIGAVDVSIEAMGAFAAIEASIATGGPQAVIAGAGPGTLGPLWAIPAARSQGARVLVLTPRTPPHLVAAYDIQESSYRQPLHLAGAELFDETILMEHPVQMPRIAIRLRHLFARPQGAVVQLCVPTNLLDCACPPLPDLGDLRIALPAPSRQVVAEVAALLRGGGGGPPAFMLGSGSVAHREQVAAAVERWGALHFSSPQATEILPGSLGVVGNAAYGDVSRTLRERDVRCVLILGSRLGTASGGNDPALLPDGCQVVHVDVDPDGVAANALATRNRLVLSVTSDIGEFLDALQHVDPGPRSTPTHEHKE